MCLIEQIVIYIQLRKFYDILQELQNYNFQYIRIIFLITVEREIHTTVTQ